MSNGYKDKWICSMKILFQFDKVIILIKILSFRLSLCILKNVPDDCLCQLHFLVRAKFHIYILKMKAVGKKIFKCTKMFIFLGNSKIHNHLK